MAFYLTRKFPREVAWLARLPMQASEQETTIASSKIGARPSKKARWIEEPHIVQLDAFPKQKFLHEEFLSLGCIRHTFFVNENVD